MLQCYDQEPNLDARAIHLDSGEVAPFLMANTVPYRAKLHHRSCLHKPGMTILPEHRVRLFINTRSAGVYYEEDCNHEMFRVHVFADADNHTEYRRR